MQLWVDRVTKFNYAFDNLAAKLNHDSKWHLDTVNKLTINLSSHISGAKRLCPETINKYVNDLMQYTIVASIPASESMPIIRAVRFTDADGCFYNDVSRMSYIPKRLSNLCTKGRVNLDGQSLFYACIGECSDKKAIYTILSECRAMKDDVFNILVGRNLSSKLSLSVIGFNDYFRRGVREPFGLNKELLSNYEYLSSILNSNSKLVVNLCEAFVSSVLSQSESEYLYDVTSAIFNWCLKFDPVDGVLYPSTRNLGYPNVALKPSAVDDYIDFESALSLHVDNAYGYGLYQVTELAKGSVFGKHVEWRLEP
ncbi:hypothetical protein CGT94_18475 [Vibrio metoecus]|nr:hypothetical protein XV93_02450 [Vibrio metoecus]PAR45378.1 hypothetical protein CGT94_18475 [Vibrio metoecus]